MRKQAFSLALAVALVMTLLGSAQAQNPAPTQGSKVGIINIQRAIVESEEGKKAQEKLRAEFAPKEREQRAKQAEIEKLRKQLQEQERALSDEARRNLVRQIETKTRDFNRTNEDFNAELRQAQGQMGNDIMRKLIKVLDQYARENGYHMVIDVSSPQTPVAWASTTVDVTDDIIKLYNASLAASTASAPGATTGRKPPSSQP